MRKIIALILAVLMLAALCVMPASAAKDNQNFGNAKKVNDSDINMKSGDRDAAWDNTVAIPVKTGDSDYANGTAWVLWSDTAIYIYTEVNDKTPIILGTPDDGEYFNAWETDSVEVFIEVDGAQGDLNARTIGNAGDACWQFRIDREGMPSSYQRSGAWTDDFLVGSANNKDRFAWAVKVDGNKYYTKHKITMLGAPKPGEMGIQIQINDKTDDGYAQIRANDASGSWNADEFGFVVLVNELAVAAAPAGPVAVGVDTLAEASAGKNALMNPEFIEGGEGFNDKEGSYSLFVYDEGSEDFPKYCTNKAPYWASWKYDQSYIVDRIIFRTANDNAQYPRRMGDGWTLSGSNDGSNWNVIYTGKESDVTNTNFQYYSVDIANSTAYQYYKLNSDIAASDQNDFIIQLSMVILCGNAAGGSAPAAEAAAPAPAAKPAVTAPKIGDTGVIVLIAVMAAAGIVIFRKKVSVK